LAEWKASVQNLFWDSGNAPRQEFPNKNRHRKHTKITKPYFSLLCRVTWHPSSQTKKQPAGLLGVAMALVNLL
jgi:hypothetical protein